jgi:hypothetical protein
MSAHILSDGVHLVRFFIGVLAVMNTGQSCKMLFDMSKCMFFNYIMVSKFYLAVIWVKFDITYLVHLFEGDLACARDLRNLGLAKPAHIRNKRTVTYKEEHQHKCQGIQTATQY